MNKRSVLLSFLASGLACLLLAGCASDMFPMGLQMTIPKTRTAEKRTATLTTFFEFNPAHTSPRYRLPAGTYVATFEDAKGIYFPAPAKLLEKRLFGTFEVAGGLYLSKGPQPRFRMYCELQPDSGGPWEKFDLPPEFWSAEGRVLFIQPALAQ